MSDTGPDSKYYLEYDDLTFPERVSNYLLLLLYLGMIIPNIIQLIKYSNHREVAKATSPWIIAFISLAILSRYLYLDPE